MVTKLFSLVSRNALLNMESTSTLFLLMLLNEGSLRTEIRTQDLPCEGRLAANGQIQIEKDELVTHGVWTLDFPC